VFTTDEEVGMEGAKSFDTSLLDGRRLINLDSEWDGVFIVSSAGSVVFAVDMPVTREPISKDAAPYRVSLTGLAGGHSGVDINKGRANAIVELAQLLEQLVSVGVQVISADGGSARNAIPREATAQVIIASSQLSEAKSIVAQAQSRLLVSYPDDAGGKFELVEGSTFAGPMPELTASNLLKAMTQVPNGVITLSPDIEGLVQTSSNLGVVTTTESGVEMQIYSRSSNSGELGKVEAEIISLMQSVGATATVTSRSPGWEFAPDSKLRDVLVESYSSLFGSSPSIEAVHAGLECAIFAEKMPDHLDMIAIGPEIVGAHSPGEKLSISSFNRVADLLVAVLAAL
jgi:dipeptidase D